MKGFELVNKIRRKVEGKGILDSPIKILDETGYIYEPLDVEVEKQPDGGHIIWIKTQAAEDDG